MHPTAAAAWLLLCPHAGSGAGTASPGAWAAGAGGRGGPAAQLLVLRGVEQEPFARVVQLAAEDSGRSKRKTVKVAQIFSQRKRRSGEDAVTLSGVSSAIVRVRLCGWRRTGQRCRGISGWRRNKGRSCGSCRRRVCRARQSSSGLQAQLQACGHVYGSAEHWELKGTGAEPNRQVQSNRSQGYAAKLRLSEAEAAPQPVIQPLLDTTTCRDDGLAWLFFRHMAPLQRRLSPTPFLTQQMLLPRLCSDHPDVVRALATPSACAPPSPPTSTPTATAGTTTPHQHSATTGQRARFCAAPTAVPRTPKTSAQSTSTTSICPRTACGTLAGAWRGGRAPAARQRRGWGSDCFNPWALSSFQHDRLVTDRVTERRGNGEGSRGAVALQWALPLYGSGVEDTDQERGNVGIVRQGTVCAHAGGENE